VRRREGQPTKDARCVLQRSQEQAFRGSAHRISEGDGNMHLPISLTSIAMRRRIASRVISVGLTIAALAFAASCGAGSSTGVVVATPIAGRTFQVVSVAGRAFPTTIGMTSITTGTCTPNVTQGITLAFHADLSFVESIAFATPAYTTNTTFVEPRLGELAVVFPNDTATVSGDTLRVRIRGITCGNEMLVAVPMK
jgi:hypothetical protein